jgi:hypothetical protein
MAGGIVYPNGFDTFTEPTLPESTSLSSAGTGSRNHLEHHRDLGDAVEALERGAQYRDHDHSGDATDIHKGSKLLQAHTHEQVDTDTAGGIHHTLGTGHEQGARGDHIHDYSQLTGAPYYRCTSTSRPANPTPGLMIWEIDTNRMRVWSTFPGNALTPGLYAVDYFNRVNAANLGTTLWEQTYLLDPATHGKLTTTDGASASWTDGGTVTNRCLARRINSVDAVTATDDQVVTWKTGDTVIEMEFPWFESQANNDAYLRMSADRNSYIRVKVAWNTIFVYYTISGWANEQQLGQLTNVETDIAGAEWRAQVVGQDVTIFRNGAPLGTISDTRSLASKGGNNRGWGIGMVAGNRIFAGQVTPANVDWVSISDYVTRTSVSRWTLLPMASLPITRLRQAQTQKFQSTGTVVQWTDEVEDTFDFFDLRAPTDIRCTEPGLYAIDAGVQWDPQVVPDVGIIAMLLNGSETTLREQRFLRGNGAVPGFSQTISMSGKIRLAQNDILQLKTSYTTSSSWLNQIFSFFNTNNKIQSRIEITYVGP